MKISEIYKKIDSSSKTYFITEEKSLASKLKLLIEKKYGKNSYKEEKIRIGRKKIYFIEIKRPTLLYEFEGKFPKPSKENKYVLLIKKHGTKKEILKELISIYKSLY
ncbi:MAG TPA: hypothetical protein EYH54_02215 [Nautiliaceae bacterium]|nr:hypothetical protein [Nautiliaceae bacterium]